MPGFWDFSYPDDVGEINAARLLIQVKWGRRAVFPYRQSEGTTQRSCCFILPCWQQGIPLGACQCGMKAAGVVLTQQQSVWLAGQWCF